MDAIRTGWDFFQSEILGMNWLNRAIGDIVEACGLDPGSRLGGSIQFFLYDVIKIMVLLGILILIISYIQSCFPPERSRRIHAKATVQAMGLNAAMEYITDMEKIMAYGVMRMPAIVVNEKVVSMGKVLKAADVEKLLRGLGCGGDAR